MNRLDRLEAETIYAVREAYASLSPLGMLWSIGKDSNALVWMIRKAFFGRAPFPMLLLDTGNVDEAIRQINTVLTRQPKHAVALTMLAQADRFKEL